MRSSSYLLCAVVLGLGGFAWPALAAAQKPNPKPNIVLILVDDLGYADMSFLPQAPEDVVTLEMDRIAAAGTYFANAYATAPICSPSRAGLITGRYQQRWGNYWYGQGGLPATEKTIPQALKDLGYATMKIGKTHLNGGEAQHPLKHGFDEFFGFIGHTKDYLRLSVKDVQAYGSANARAAHIGPLERNAGKMVSFEDQYSTDLFTEEAIGYIKRDHGDKPFYLHLSYNAVHHPTYIGHPDYLKKLGIEQFPFWDPKRETYKVWHKKWGHLGAVDPNGRKRYLATLMCLDDGIGRILDTLKKKGIRDNTIIALLSDNGGTINTYSNNAPLRGYKYMFGEGGLRIPMILSWPGHWPAGKTSRVMVSAMDIFPTLVEAAGGTPPKNLDGLSLLPDLLNKQRFDKHSHLCFAKNANEWVVRQGPWKLIKTAGWDHLNFKMEGGIAKRAENEIYPAGLLLFDLSKDIGETTNVAAKHPQIVKQLTALHDKWQAQMGKPVRGNKKKK